MQDFMENIRMEGSADVIAYVDDLRLFVPATRDPNYNCTLLQRVFTLIASLERSLLLVFNSLKTHLMKQHAAYSGTVRFKGHILTPSRRFKYLGLTFDARQSFNPLVTSVLKKVRKRLGLVKVLSHRLTLPQKRAAIQGYALSVLRYYITPVWPRLSKTNQGRITSSWRQMVRIATGLPVRTPISTLAVASGWLPPQKWFPYLRRIGRSRLLQNAPDDARVFLDLSANFIQRRRSYEFIPRDSISTDPEMARQEPEPSGLHYYTDGSLQRKQAGAGFISILDGHTLLAGRWKLDIPSIELAEMVALAKAFEHYRNSSEAPVTFHTDRLGIVQTLSRGIFYEPLAPLFEAITSGAPIRVRWVKAHLGIAGNELADEEAKQAILDGSPLPLPHLHSYYKTVVATNRWNMVKRNKLLSGRLKDGCAPPFRIARKLHPGAAAYARWAAEQSYDLRTAAAWGNRPSDSCPICEVSGSFDHFLHDCPALSAERTHAAHRTFQLVQTYPKLLPQPLVYAEHNFPDVLDSALAQGLRPALMLLKQTERFIKSL